MNVMRPVFGLLEISFKGQKYFREAHLVRLSPPKMDLCPFRFYNKESKNEEINDLDRDHLRLGWRHGMCTAICEL
jgi:hypothetical protein